MKKPVSGEHRTKRPSAQFRAKVRGSPHNSSRPVPKSSAQLDTREKQANFRLTGPGKKRGPKPKIEPSEVINRAEDLRFIFKIFRGVIDWTKLFAAQCPEDVNSALALVDERDRKRCLYNPGLILQCLKDPRFPKSDRDAQERFIIESVAGDGRVSMRRSRDICGETRAVQKRQGRIIRREFYIGCTCGFEGPALNDACPDCGAPVPYADLTLSLGT